MEQLIPIINFLKKNRFWLTCGVIAIAAIVTWFFSTSALHKEKLAAERKIDGMITSVNGVIKTGATGIESPVAHPNDQTNRGMEQEISKATDSLLKAWKLRREAQESVLKWPDISADDFVQTFSELLPAEKYMDRLAAVNWESKIAVYRTEIPEHMERICEIIGAKWQHGKDASNAGGGDAGSDPRQGGGPSSVAGGGGDGRGGGDEPAEEGDSYEDQGVVVWSRANQSLWYDKLTQFKGRDGQDSVSGEPTPIQVIALQQDLWLLEALYKTIKEVNGDADANDLAVIKEIHHVVVGREARSQLGTLKVPNPQLAQAEPTGNENNQNTFNNNNNNATEQDKPFDPYPGEGLEKYSPFHGRYVDADFKPIPAKKLFDVLNAEGELPEEYLELLVAKRVPVRIAVRMDSQKIDDFIAACGNSSFAFEVSQVRIDRPRDSVQVAAVSSEGTGLVQPTPSEGGGGRDGGGRGGEQSTSGSGGAAVAANGTPVHLRTTSDVDVEFYGIVKIYNPVNEKIIEAITNKDNSVNPNPNP